MGNIIKKGIWVMVVLFAGINSGNAQVVNRALSFGESGLVECGEIQSLNGKDSFSLQFWMNPSEWKDGASLITIGKEFNVKLGKPEELVFSSGHKKLSVKSHELAPDVWNQVTLICSKGEATVLINGKESAKGKMTPFPDRADLELFIGGDYKGYVDEIRLWDGALNEDMKKFDYFTNNTLNKWCPMWNNLIVYYKMDQEDCNYLVDYKDLLDLVDSTYNSRDYEISSEGSAGISKGEKGYVLEYPVCVPQNHGVFKGDVKRVEANNEKMPYLINGAYIQTDRALNWNIPVDQYLLSNQLLILGADAYSDGHIEEKTPNNHAELRKIYDRRGGVKTFMCIQGTYRVRDKFGDWREILGDEAKHKRFAEDLASLSKDYDGVELDLEWIEVPLQWTQFGELAQQIRKALPSDKEFRISLHNNYYAFPEKDMDVVDGFTFQQYGPNSKNFSYENFLANVEKFKGKFDADKIMTSYSTTTSKGENGSPVLMIRFDVLSDYKENYDDVDQYKNEEDTWSYMGPMQVYRRARHTRENNLQGIFYWDIAGDNREPRGEIQMSDIGNLIPKGEEVLEGFNQAKYCSYGIDANNDPIVESIQIP